MNILTNPRLFICLQNFWRNAIFLAILLGSGYFHYHFLEPVMDNQKLYTILITVSLTFITMLTASLAIFPLFKNLKMKGALITYKDHIEPTIIQLKRTLLCALTILGISILFETVKLEKLSLPSLSISIAHSLYVGISVAMFYPFLLAIKEIIRFLEAYLTESNSPPSGPPTKP